MEEYMTSTTRYCIDERSYSADEVQRLFAPNSLGLGRRQRLVAEMASELLDKRDARGLDIGCYFGSFAAHLARRHKTAELYACDYFLENLRVARLLFPEGPPFIQANVYRLPFKDASLDFVSLQEVLEHLDRPLDAVREINRVLKDHAMLVVTVPNAQYWRIILAELGRSAKRALAKRTGRALTLPHEIYYDSVEWNRHLYCWTTTTLHTLFLVCGFTLTHLNFSGSDMLSRLVPALGSEIVMGLEKTGPPQKALL